MGKREPTKPDAAAFKDRLRATLAKAHGAPDKNLGAWLGGLYGVSKAAGGDWINGRTLPEAWRVLDMADRWGVPFMWLYFGRGEMNSTKPLSESGRASPLLRLDVLTMAIEAVDVELGELSPTPAQRARAAALFYALLDQGTPMAEVRSFARRAGMVITGGGDAEPRGGDGT